MDESERDRRITELEATVAQLRGLVAALEKRIDELESALGKPARRRIVADMTDQVGRSLDAKPGKELPERPGPQIS